MLEIVPDTLKKSTMMSLLSLFTGSWKKNGRCRTCPGSRPCRPSLRARPPLRSGSGCSPTMSASWPEAWRTVLCVYGSRGGLGKTRVVLETLKEEGVEPVTLTGIARRWRCTGLYEHPESVVFLDDCDAMFRNLPALGILRSALWEGEKGNRLVNYNSSASSKSRRRSTSRAGSSSP